MRKDFELDFKVDNELNNKKNINYKIHKEILEEIQLNFKTKLIIKHIYYNKYYHLLFCEKDADLNWLVSDIILYFKLNKLNNYKYISKTYNKYIINNININIQFNYFWNKLTIFEKINFINIFKKSKYFIDIHSI